MLTTVRRSRPKGPLRAVPGATNNRKIGGRLCYCDKDHTECIHRAEFSEAERYRLSISLIISAMEMLDVNGYTNKLQYVLDIW